MKNEIKFNDGSVRIKNTFPMSLVDQENVIDALNYLLENDNGNINKRWVNLLQQFVDMYVKLEHYRSTTEGLYAFDSDPRHLLREFWGHQSDACPLEITEAENQEDWFERWVAPLIIHISFE